MEESAWYKNIENQVFEQSEKLYKRDFKFFQVDTFLKLSKKIDLFSTNCKACKELKTSAENIANELSDQLKGDMASRKKYEKKLDEIDKHLRSVHRIYPNQYYISLFSFIGLFTGIALGTLFMYLINRNDIKEGFIAGIVFGLLAGRIYGKLLDKKVRKEGRNLE